MSAIPESIDAYLERLVPERPEPARAMERRAERTGFPIIGPACGHLCYQLGRVLEDADDPDTAGVRELTRALTTDRGWITTVFPGRDGMLVAYRAHGGGLR